MGATPAHKLTGKSPKAVYNPLILVESCRIFPNMGSPHPSLWVPTPMSAPVGVCKIEASLSPSERKNEGIELKSLEKLKYIKPHRPKVEV